MSQQPHRIGGRTAEDLLNGADVASPYPVLAATLRAAAAPARPGELAGRQAAVAAFRVALQDHSAPFGRRSRIRTPVLRLTLRAAVIAAVVLGTGGVALAASTGALELPLNRHHPVPSTPATTPRPGVGPGSSTHPGSADPSPSLVGLCHSYLAGAGSDHGKALENPAFQALITEAGGKDAVDTFCARLLATPEPSETPGGHPSATPPEQAATDHPGNKPSGHTTGKPSTPPGK